LLILKGLGFLIVVVNEASFSKYTSLSTSNTSLSHDIQGVFILRSKKASSRLLIEKFGFFEYMKGVLINVILRFPKSYCMVVAMMVVVVTVVLVVVAAYEMRILTLEREITKLKEVSKT
jgi:phage-related minor tail protein